MRIITLGNSARLLHYLLDGHEIVHYETPLILEEALSFQPELVISFGYRHIVKNDLLNAFQNKIINLHISLLPWNKGADPNFWSWFDQTPKGVTIHLIDEGLDTGDILFQKEVKFHGPQTLVSSYELLQREMIMLFEENLHKILNLKFIPVPQVPGSGSNHKSVDKEKIFSKLPLGWDTSCFEIQDLGKNPIS